MLKTKQLNNIPFWRLTTPLIDRRLLRFLAQASGTIRILLAHRLPVRQILRSVAYHDQRANLRPVDAHVGVDARGVRDLLLLPGSHGGRGPGCIPRTGGSNRDTKAVGECGREGLGSWCAQYGKCKWVRRCLRCYRRLLAVGRFRVRACRSLAVWGCFDDVDRPSAQPDDGSGRVGYARKSNG